LERQNLRLGLLEAAAGPVDRQSAQVRHGRPRPAAGCQPPKVLIAEQRIDIWSAHQFLQKAAHGLVIEEPLAVVRKGGGVPNWIVRPQANNPAVQQVVVELLEQKPFGANPVERLQERGQQESLWRHRGPAFCGVERAKGGIEPIKGRIRQFSDPPQRITGRDSLLDRHVGEQGAAALQLTSHLGWAVALFSRRTGIEQTLNINHQKVAIEAEAKAAKLVAWDSYQSLSLRNCRRRRQPCNRSWK